MADSEKLSSEIGFNASDAIREINKLAEAFQTYTQSLRTTADGTKRTVAEQSKLDRAIAQNAKSVQQQVKAYQALARAQAALAKTQPKIDSQAQAKVAAAARASVESSLFSGFRDRATLGEVVNFDKSLDALDKLVTRTDISQDQITKILGNLKGQYTGAERVIRDSIAKIVAANAKLGAANVKAQAGILKKVTPAEQPGAAFSKITPLAQQREADLRNAFRGSLPPTAQQANESVANSRKVKDGIQEITVSWSALAKIAVSQFIIGQMRAIVGAFQEGARAAIDFEISLARIQTLDKDFQRGGLDQVATVVTGLASEFGRPIDDVAAGLYDALSNQIGNATESTQFLREALQLSVATVSTTTQSVDVLTGVINSYGLTAASAGSISDKLFRTVDLGNVKLEDMANSLGRLNPLASALGVSFDEVLASVAELTIQGVDFADASTQITNVMLKLIRPTEALSKRFEELGVSSGEAGVAAFGFQGFLQEIVKDTGTAASEIGEFFNQIRGTRGVIGLVTTNAERYQKTLKDIQTASEGATKAAADTILNTPAAQIQRQFTELESFLTNDFGRGAISAFNTLTQSIGGITNALKALLVVGAPVAVALGVIAAKAVGLLVFNSVAGAVQAVTTALTFLGASVTATTVAIAALPVALGLGLAVAITQFGNAAKSASDFRNEIDQINQTSAKQLEERLQSVQKSIRTQIDDNQRLARSALQALQGRSRLAFEDKAEAERNQNLITKSFQEQLAKRESLVQQFVGRLASIQAEATDKIRSLQDASTNARNQTGARQFERAISGLGKQEQTAALIQRSQQLITASNQAFGKGNTDIANNLIEQADALANRAADLGAGEAQVNAVLSARVNLNDRLVAQTQAQAAEAANLEREQRRIADAISQEVETQAQLQEKLQEGLKTGKLSAKQEKELRRGLSQSAQETERLLGQVDIGNLGNVTDLVNLKRQIQSNFIDPLSNQPVSLSFAVENSLNSVFSTLQRQALATPISLRLQFTNLTGQPFDPNTFFSDFQNGIAESLKRVNQETQNQEGQVAASQAVDTAYKNAAVASSTIKNNLTSITDTASINLDTLFGVGDSEAIRQRGIQTGERIQAAIDAGFQAASSGDTTLLNAALGDLTKFQQAFEQNASFGTSTATQGIVASLKQVQTEIANAAKAQATLEQASNLSTLQTSLVNVERATSELGVAQQSASQVSINAINQEIAVVQQLEAAKRRAAQVGGAGGGGAQTFAHGGKVLHFASGGFVPHSDTVPAMLTPGEMVLNPRASRRFALDATAMNLGLTGRSGDNTLNQNVTIKIDGSGDPNAVADAVIRRIERGKRAHIYR